MWYSAFMRVIAVVFYTWWLVGCSAVKIGMDWRARASGMLGIEDRYRGCSSKMVFVPVERERVSGWVPEGFVIKEPGQVGVASFNCRISAMETGPVSFAMVVIVVEEPKGVFDPGLLDVYEVARVTSGKKQKEMLSALGYRIEEQNEMFPFTVRAFRDFELKGMHVRVWHRVGGDVVYTLMHFGEHTSSIGAVGGCAIREGTLLREMAGKSSCDGAMGQVSKDVDFSVLIRI